MKTLTEVHANDLALIYQVLQEAAQLRAQIAPIEAMCQKKHKEAAESLARIIVGVIETHGYFQEKSDKTFCRWMCCSTRIEYVGFSDVIEREFGSFNWHTLYAAAIERLRVSKKIYFSSGMGECSVDLIEQLSPDDVARIKAERAQVRTP
jgi:hypothetical protein